MLTPKVTHLTATTAHPSIKLTPSQAHAAERCQSITMGGRK